MTELTSTRSDPTRPGRLATETHRSLQEFVGTRVILAVSKKGGKNLFFTALTDGIGLDATDDVG